VARGAGEPSADERRMMAEAVRAANAATARFQEEQRMQSTEHEDRRVEFDFEVDFSNGGGIQGQGFRLDIDGEDIEDDELAAYIVRDLRLLMVGEVRILNKRILRERHKRSAVTRAERAGDGIARIDLSHVVEDGMITCAGMPAPIVYDFLSRKEGRARHDPGTQFQIGAIELRSNTGTYVESPFHRFADGIDLSELPLERLAELDAVTVNVTGAPSRAVDRTHLLPYELAGKAVLIYTGWDRHWRTEAYQHDHPYLTADAAEHLLEQGALLVGIDSLSIDDTDDGARPVRTSLLASGLPICEHLTNLAALPTDGFRFSAVPAKVRRMGTFPVRAYATLG
jgi:kynurenine formamidase